MKIKYLSWIFLFFLFIPCNLSSQNERFQDFILHFCFDSIFQKERILFPLEYIYWNYEEDIQSQIYITKEHYKYDSLFCDENDDAYPMFYNNFDCELVITTEMVFRWKGYTDVDIRYYFKLLDMKWFLVKIQDYDAGILNQ